MNTTAECFFGSLEKLVDNNFKTKWNTDLTIICQDEQFFAHKIIMGAHSEFFRKACDPESVFKEARTGVINLEDDDPFFVKLMLVYCYTGNLDDKMIAEWDETHYTRYPNEGVGVAVFSIVIYALADKYQIKDLKIKAEDRLKWWFRRPIDFEEYWPVVIPQLARKIYTTTPSTDRGLRDLVLFCVLDDIDNFMKIRRFKTKMSKIDGFWADFAEYSIQVGKRKRPCPNCYGYSEPVFPRWTVRRSGATAECPHCKKSHTWQEWNDLEDADEAIEPDDDSDDEATQPLELSNKRKANAEDELDSFPAKFRRLARRASVP